MFFSSCRELRQIAAQNAELLRKVDTIMSTNAQFLTDVTALTTAVAANTAAIKQVSALVATDTATITDLTAQIAALKAANPALDLTGLESGITSLLANNTALTGIVPVAPAPVPPAAG